MRAESKSLRRRWARAPGVMAMGRVGRGEEAGGSGWEVALSVGSGSVEEEEEEEAGCCCEEASRGWETGSPSLFMFLGSALSGCACEEGASVAIFLKIIENTGL